MDSVPESHDGPALAPLPYHIAIRDYLKTEEADIWQWYSSNRVREERAEAVKFDLLKSTYRVDREERTALYEAAEEVSARLSLDVPITIYQAQNPVGLNASSVYVPGEAHIVFHGPITAKLTEAELRALLAHELSHLSLLHQWDGEYLIVDQILAALTNDRHAETAHFAAARLFRLYTEIFCDRGALAVMGDPAAVVSMLVKVSTELEEVSAESYIRQAEEIFSKGPTKAAELTHPEPFIRARAVMLYANADNGVAGADGADAEIAAMIEGTPALDDLDLLAQVKVSNLTRRLLDAYLSPEWIQSDPVLAHARLFFEDYAVPDDPHKDPALVGDLKTDDAALLDYYCYVLLDFITADRDLEEYPLAAALTLTEELGLKDRFSEIARKELRLRKKQLAKIDSQKGELLATAAGTLKS